MREYTVRDAASALGMSEQAIRARIGRGDMKARRIGARLWLISAREVEKWRKIGKVREGRPRGDGVTPAP